VEKITLQIAINGKVALEKNPVLKKYSFEEVVAKSTLYFKGDSLAANVWANKYALKDSDGNLYELTPDDMHRRIAREIARIEQRYTNPMSEEEIFTKFENCFQFAKNDASSQKVKRAFDVIKNVEAVEDVGCLPALLC